MSCIAALHHMASYGQGVLEAAEQLAPGQHHGFTCVNQITYSVAGSCCTVPKTGDVIDRIVFVAADSVPLPLPHPPTVEECFSEPNAFAATDDPSVWKWQVHPDVGLAPRLKFVNVRAPCAGEFLLVWVLLDSVPRETAWLTGSRSLPIRVPFCPEGNMAADMPDDPCVEDCDLNIGTDIVSGPPLEYPAEISRVDNSILGSVSWRSDDVPCHLVAGEHIRLHVTPELHKAVCAGAIGTVSGDTCRLALGPFRDAHWEAGPPLIPLPSPPALPLGDNSDVMFEMLPSMLPVI